LSFSIEIVIAIAGFIVSLLSLLYVKNRNELKDLSEKNDKQDIKIENLLIRSIEQAQKVNYLNEKVNIVEADISNLIKELNNNIKSLCNKIVEIEKQLISLNNKGQ
jgi:hypothetical protein